MQRNVRFNSNASLAVCAFVFLFLSRASVELARVALPLCSVVFYYFLLMPHSRAMMASREGERERCSLMGDVTSLGCQQVWRHTESGGERCDSSKHNIHENDISFAFHGKRLRLL
jgi:hypothetical protein